MGGRRIRVKVVRNKTQEDAQGIHLLKPSNDEIELAKEDAAIKGFTTVWVHRK